jgi:hypothetical protein
MVNAEQIQTGIQKYIFKEIATKGNSLNKFAVYFLEPFIISRIPTYVDNFSKNEFLKDLFDDNKNLDLEKCYNYAKTAIQKSGQIMVEGMFFNETDIDKIYAYIRGDL